MEWKCPVHTGADFTNSILHAIATRVARVGRVYPAAACVSVRKGGVERIGTGGMSLALLMQRGSDVVTRCPVCAPGRLESYLRLGNSALSRALARRRLGSPISSGSARCCPDASSPFRDRTTPFRLSALYSDLLDRHPEEPDRIGWPCFIWPMPL
jgi:hypothetical protein